MEQALLDHFPEMPQYATRVLSGDVFEQVQEFHQLKVHPFPNHLLPPSMRRGEDPRRHGRAIRKRRIGWDFAWCASTADEEPSERSTKSNSTASVLAATRDWKRVRHRRERKGRRDGNAPRLGRLSRPRAIR